MSPAITFKQQRDEAGRRATRTRHSGRAVTSDGRPWRYDRSTGIGLRLAAVVPEQAHAHAGKRAYSRITQRRTHAPFALHDIGYPFHYSQFCVTTDSIIIIIDWRFTEFMLNGLESHLLGALVEVGAKEEDPRSAYVAWKVVGSSWPAVGLESGISTWTSGTTIR